MSISRRLEAWGRFVHRRRGTVLLMALVLVATTLGAFAFSGELLDPGEPNPSTEAGKAAALIQNEIPAANDPSILLILGHEEWAWTDERFEAAVRDVEAAARSEPQVTRVLSPYDGGGAQLVSHDGHKIALVIGLDPEATDAAATYDDIRASLESDVLDATATGGPVLDHTFGTIIGEDLARAELVTLPVALIILFIVFGALVAALLPLAVGGLAVAGGVALTLAFANIVDVPDYAIQIVSLIGLGVAIDYSLFIVKRFREELEAQRSREEALGRTLGTAGHAVLFSGITVAASLGGLAFFHGTELAGVGLAVFAVVVLAVAHSLMLLPAILAFLGPKVNAIHLPQRGTTSGIWHRIAGAVMRRPILFLVLALAILLPMAAPIASIQLGGFSIEQLPPDNDARQGAETLATEFPSQGSSEILVAVDWGSNPLTPQRIEHLHDFTTRLQELPGVNGVTSPVTIAPDLTAEDYQEIYAQPRHQWPEQFQRAAEQHVANTIVLVSVASSYDDHSTEAKRLVQEIRTHDVGPGGDLLVSGATAAFVDGTEVLRDRAPLAITFILTTTLAILAAQTRSLVLPVKALVMNTVSIAASFGAVVLVFQHGFGAEFLNITPNPLILDNLVLMACIVFGLSMDYEVLLLGRIREEYDRTGNNEEAVRRGLEHSGRVITGAALIMVFVFSAFGLVRLAFIKMIGLGLALAVLLDATIVRALLVPSLMRLMGRANWWAPSWLKPRQATPAVTRIAKTTQPSKPRPVNPRFADPAVARWHAEELAGKRRRH